MRLAGPNADDLAPPARKGVWRQSGSSWRKIPLCTDTEAEAESIALASATQAPKFDTGQWAPYPAPSCPAHTFEHAWCSSDPSNVWNSHPCLSAISPPDQQGAVESCLLPLTRGWKKKLMSRTELSVAESQFAYFCILVCKVWYENFSLLSKPVQNCDKNRVLMLHQWIIANKSTCIAWNDPSNQK